MTMLGDDVLGGALTLGGADGRLQQGSRQGSKRQAPRFWNWRKLEKWKFQKDFFKSFLKLMMKIGEHWIFIRNWTTNVVLGVNSIWNGMTLMWGCRQGRVRPGPSRRGWQSNEVLVIPSLSWEDHNQNPDYFKVRSTWFVVEFQTGQAFRLWVTIGGSVGFNVFWREL